jgi:hypothetical protein
MRGSRFWRWRQPGAGVAFTAHSVVALNLAGGRRSEAAELPDGLIESSASAPNIQSASDLARVVQRLLDGVEARGERLAVVLPDLALTTQVFSGARRSEKQLRRELGASLPYPAAEARFDFWRGPGGQTLGAAVRDAVARQYERIVEAVDCSAGWVDGASLSQIPVRAARPASLGLVAIDVQLYVGHYCLTLWRGGALVDARVKLRSGGDVELIAREVRRAAVLHEADTVDSLRLSGVDATAVAEALGDASELREVQVDREDERAQLETSIETLLERGSP